MKLLHPFPLNYNNIDWSIDDKTNQYSKKPSQNRDEAFFISSTTFLFFLFRKEIPYKKTIEKVEGLPYHPYSISNSKVPLSSIWLHTYLSIPFSFSLKATTKTCFITLVSRKNVTFEFMAGLWIQPLWTWCKHH